MHAWYFVKNKKVVDESVELWRKLLESMHAGLV